MTFKEYLIYGDIPFTENSEGIAVDDYLLEPFELDLKEKVKGVELWWDYLRYKNEPNRSRN